MPHKLKVNEYQMLVCILWAWVIGSAVIAVATDCMLLSPAEPLPMVDESDSDSGFEVSIVFVVMASAGCWSAFGVPVAILCGIYGYIKLAHRRVESKLRGETRRCYNCGYALIGPSLYRCSECGTVPDRNAEIKTLLRKETWKELLRLSIAGAFVLVTVFWLMYYSDFLISLAVVVPALVGWYVHRLATRLIV